MTVASIEAKRKTVACDRFMSRKPEPRTRARDWALIPTVLTRGHCSSQMPRPRFGGGLLARPLLAKLGWLPPRLRDQGIANGDGSRSFITTRSASVDLEYCTKPRTDSNSRGGAGLFAG